MRSADIKDVVLEPYADGHHGVYAKWIAQGLLAAGRGVLLVTTEQASAHPSMREASALAGVRLVTLPLPTGAESAAHGRLAQWRRELLHLGLLRSMFRTARASVRVSGVIVPYMDYCYHAMALFGAPFARTPWCGITMRMVPQSVDGRKSLRLRLAKRYLRDPSLRGLFTIDPRHGECGGGQKMAPSKLQYLADPVEIEPGASGNAWRERLSIADDEHVVLVFGALDARKGVLELLCGLAAVSGGRRIVALLAGRVVPGFAAALDHALSGGTRLSSRLKIVDRVIEDGEIPGLFAAADSAWLGYVGHHHMSGVFTLAAAYGLPIVATREGVIGYLARKTSEVWMVDPLNAGDVAATLQHLADRGRVRRSCAECQAIAEHHSVTAFGRDIAASLADNG